MLFPFRFWGHVGPGPMAAMVGSEHHGASGLSIDKPTMGLSIYMAVHVSCNSQ